MRRDYTAKIKRDKYYTRYIVEGYENYVMNSGSFIGSLVYRDTFKTEKEARRAANDFMKRHFKFYNQEQ